MLNDSGYDFCWYVYAIPAPKNVDTISHERNLNYTVTLELGEYLLTYRVRNKRTDICALTQTVLNLASIYNDIWVVAKDKGNEAGIDIITSEGQVLSDMLALVNRGGSGLPERLSKRVILRVIDILIRMRTGILHINGMLTVWSW